ncbi:MAG: glycosyltransferase family 39 protein [Terriglobales bacterium]
MRTSAPGNSSTTPAPVPRSRGWAHRVTLGLLLAACIVVRLVCLACKPFWFDEAFSVEVARLTWPNFLHLLWWREANMSLYYVLLRAWLRFGQGPYFIRSLSVLMVALTLPAIYWLARLLFDRRVALIAAALFTFNAYHVRYSQEARGYSLFMLLATASSCLLVWWLAEPSRRRLRGYIAASVLAVYSHFYALLLIAAHWLVLQVTRPPQIAEELPASRLRRAWWTTGLLVLPLLTFVAKTGAGPIRWIHRPGPRDLVEFFEHLCGSNGWPLALLYVAACTVAACSVGQRLWKRDPSRDVWRLQFLLIWLFLPIVLTALLSFARPVFLGRYMIFCLPPLLILAAAGLERLRRPWMLGAALAVMLFFSLQGIFFVYGHDFDSERDASESASNFILDQAQPSDAILFHIAETRIPYEFSRSLRAGRDTANPSFTDQLGPAILFPHHGRGLDYRDFTGKPAPDLVRQAASAYRRLWLMLMNNGTDEKPDATTVMLTQTLPQFFPKVQRWRFAKVEVRLYSK